MNYKFTGKIIKAFTLAEVLITLAIIGVVAALCIPSLVNSFQESEYNTGVQKAYSMISNALTRIKTDNGGVVNVGNDATSTGDNAFKNDFCSVMSCVKIDSVRNIFGHANYSFYKGGYIGWPANDGADTTSMSSAILSNGNYIRFRSYSNCTNGAGNACGSITIDINGSKGPNMFGKDNCEFFITLNNGNYLIVPLGTSGDGNSCTAGSNAWNTTHGCTYQRLFAPNNMP